MSRIDVLILCGGQGRRLRSIANGKPKPLALIGERPFLDLLLDEIHSFGFKRIILSIGYQKEQIVECYSNRPKNRILFCKEETPLGTGGAVKNAMPMIKSESFLVMNGDSFCRVDYGELCHFHQTKNSILSVVTTTSTIGEDNQDYGNIRIDHDSRITKFAEKSHDEQTGGVSAGIYLMEKDIFGIMPQKHIFSLEYDLFPAILENRCYAFKCDGPLIDIGTPDRYHAAVEALFNPS